jgi:hypothetical protein
MRKTLLLFLFAFISYHTSKATIVTVYVGGIGLSRPTVSATCGDTIKWIWNGATDSVRSTTIPGCGISWKSPIDASTPNFSVVVPCAGTYSYNAYVLNPTVTNYPGTINVTCATGILPVFKPEPELSIFPNPGKGSFVVSTNQTDLQNLELFDLNGKEVFNQRIMGNTTIDLSTLGEGIYLMKITSLEGIITRKIVITR